MAKNKKLQAEKFAEKLKEIRPDVAADDKKSFADTEKCQLSTISTYLNGKGTDPALACRMYMAFKKIIADRNLVLG